ncbi:W protein [Achimota virus 1]|uniref:W protein n=1 Tax=Achimota virus 1 TaxID=1261100 RepID=K7XN65_9MONO|nr:W protein [Achimota virus 1]AFX75106.1 W protein [Achimota virus 1]
MDTNPSDEEISAWIDKGLDTIQHFVSGPVTSQSSLGKSTIKPGNTRGLVKSAESKSMLAKLAPPSSMQPAPPPREDQASSSGGARPKSKKSVSFQKPQASQSVISDDAIYEEVIRPDNDEFQPLLQKSPSPEQKAKDRLLNTVIMGDHQPPSTSHSGQPFKRGGSE